MDMLDHSAVAPLLHMPVNDVLKQMGLPPLPQLPPMPPLPQLPPLPTIDIGALLKPLTDLMSGFGSGDMSSAPFNPMQLFEGLMQAFQSVVQMGGQAMSALTPLWTGPAAAQAMASGTAAQANGTATGAQSGDISTVVATATATVAKGVAMLQGIIASFVATLPAAIGLAFTPGGQAAIIASATVHLNEGLAVVAETRGELFAHTANMTRAGAPVAITAVPQVASQIPGMAMTTVQTISQPIQSLIKAGGGAGGLGGRHSADLGGRDGDDLDLGARGEGASAGGGGGAVPMGVGGIGGVGSSGPAAPLSPRTTPDSLGGPRGGIPGGKVVGDSEERVVTRATTPAAMPMGAGGAMGATPSAGGQHNADREQVVDARHTEEIVGEIPSASPTVLGGVEASVSQSIWEESDELEA